MCSDVLVLVVIKRAGQTFDGFQGIVLSLLRWEAFKFHITGFAAKRKVFVCDG